MHLDRAPAASSRDVQPAAAVPVERDGGQNVFDAPPPEAATAETAPAAAEAQPPVPDDAQTDTVFPTVNGVRCLRILVTHIVSAVEKEVLLAWDATYQ